MIELGKFELALQDAEKAIDLANIGWDLKGHALLGLNRHNEAMRLFTEKFGFGNESSRIINDKL